MQTKFSRVINFLYGPYFKVVGFFYRIFTTNRARIERLKTNQTFSAILKGFTLLVLVGWANLRGVKEAGRLFAIPTYAFVVMVVLLQ